MAWRPSRLSAEQMEERRRAAVKMLRRGCSQAEVAREMGVSATAVSFWTRVAQARGLRGLKARPRTGRPSRLSEHQWKKVRRIIRWGAKRAGYDTERWTLRRVAQLIEHLFGVHYHPNYLAVPLRQMGLTPQQPPTQAKERQDALVEAWLKHDWPRIKRGLLAQGQPLPWWMRRVTHFGPLPPRPGPLVDTRPC
jgi:transposase